MAQKEYDQRFAAAKAELDAAGFWDMNALPPYVHFMRSVGRKPRPPHYLPFGKALLGFGVWLGATWGMLMWFTLWRTSGMPIQVAVISTIVCGPCTRQ